MEQQKKHTQTTRQRCTGGAIAVAVLAGLVTIPAVPAAAAPSPANAVTAHAAERADTKGLSVTHGLQYAPGDRLGLTGTAAAGANVTITGLPRKGGAIDRPQIARADSSGKWIVFTVPGSALADAYELAITSGSESIDVTARADADHEIVHWDVTVAAGQTVEHGERPTVTGTADAYTSVQILGLPGWKPGDPGVGALADEHGEWTITGEEPATSSFIVEARGNGHGQLRSVQEWVDQAPRDGEFEAFTIEEGLVYAPGSRIALSGSALPGTVIKIDGLPTRDGAPATETTRRVAADERGEWRTLTDAKLTTADHYDLRFTVGGSTIERRAVADESHAPVQRDVTVADGQTFVHGEIATVTGTADAHTSVRVDGLPGRSAGYGVTADRLGNWTATSAEPVNAAFRVQVQGLQHGSTSPVVEGLVLPAPRDGEFDAFEIERGLRYLPGHALVLAGTALPFSRTEIAGLPSDASDTTKTQTVVADVDGRWAVASVPGAPSAERYERTFTVGGSSVQHTATADPSLEIVERDLAFATGQSFVTGERATLRGTADAHSAVYVRGLPGDPANGKIVVADSDGNWVATSGEPVSARTEVTVNGYGNGAFKNIHGTIVPREQEQTAPITVATTTFVKGQKQLIEGTAEPKARVDIYSGSTYLMNVTANAEGKWSYTTGGVINTDTFTRTLKSEGAKDLTFTLNAQ